MPTVQSLGVRAYLGIPLKFGGMAIGSFCAIDFHARAWSPLQIEVMEELAASTMREIELRAAARAACAAGGAFRRTCRARSVHREKDASDRAHCQVRYFAVLCSTSGVLGQWRATHR
ncbi:MAG TPA: GAF domain-containing protein [Thermoanaerobaculia bacterium]|nr:GAF domain-containing protein [Thermoanaerobaculia bacterium]